MWIKSCVTGARVNLAKVDKILIETHQELPQVTTIGYRAQVLFKGTQEECENYLQHLDVYLGVACAEVILNPRNRTTPK